MSALLNTVVPVSNAAAPDRSMDGSGLPKEDGQPAENWDGNLDKFDQQGAGSFQAGSQFLDDKDFVDSPGGSQTLEPVDFDTIMAGQKVGDESLNRHDNSFGVQPHGNVAVATPPPPTPPARPVAAAVTGEGVATAPTPEYKLGVDVPGFGTIDFTYADVLLDDHFLLLTVHPKYAPLKFDPPTAKDSRQMTFILHGLDSKATVIPLCPALVSVTKSGKIQQLFKIKALESTVPHGQERDDQAPTS